MHKRTIDRVLNIGKRTHRKAIWRAVWLPILRQFLSNQEQGGAMHVAKAIRIHLTLIHKYACEKCDHDVAPTKHWRALTEWLAVYHAAPFCVLSGIKYRAIRVQPENRHRQGCTKQMRINAKRRRNKLASLAK